MIWITVSNQYKLKGERKNTLSNITCFCKITRGQYYHVNFLGRWLNPAPLTLTFELRAQAFCFDWGLLASVVFFSNIFPSIFINKCAWAKSGLLPDRRTVLIRYDRYFSKEVYTVLLNLCSECWMWNLWFLYLILFIDNNIRIINL